MSNFWKDLNRVAAKQDEETRKLMKKFPKFTMFMNCLLVLLIFAGLTSVIAWKAQERTERIQAYMDAQALALQEEEQLEREREAQAALLASEQAEKQRRENEVLLMAKLLSGIDSFVDKYGYSDGDIKTYAECVINRVISKRDGFPDTITEVILQKNQWVGFSEKNVIVEKYYRIAKQVVDDYYANKPRPCSSDYCWAELNRDGIWLKKEFNSDPHIRMWRY